MCEITSSKLNVLGTDLWGSIVLEFKDGFVANLFYSGCVGTPCRASVVGKHGRIEVGDHEMYFPNSV